MSCDPVAQQSLVLPGRCLQGVPGKSLVAWVFLAAFDQAPSLALRAQLHWTDLDRCSQMWTSSTRSPSWSSASGSWSGCQKTGVDAGLGAPEPAREVGSITLKLTPGWFGGWARGLVPACTVLIMGLSHQPATALRTPIPAPQCSHNFPFSSFCKAFW